MMSWLERQWYKDGLWAMLLMPLDILLNVLIWLRRTAYLKGWLRSWRAPVPVVIVGNITVGGTGKTPLVLWLVDYLRAHGRHPGIISRGYGGQNTGVMEVTPQHAADVVGDEPLLVARRVNCPVFVGRDRPAAARALLAAYPECDVLLSDDGLQHYALQRDIELVVVDGKRLYGNGCLMPAGPLREPIWRLNTVDAVVINGGEADLWEDEYEMRLHGQDFRRLNQPAEVVHAQDFQGKRLHAIAGIGHPARFFSYLASLGLHVVDHPYPDHHQFAATDLQIADADAILMTEKDAVKCLTFAPDNCWYLPVEAEVLGDLGGKILETLNSRSIQMKVNDGREVA